MRKNLFVVLVIVWFLSTTFTQTATGSAFNRRGHKIDLLLVGVTAYRPLIELYPSNDVNVTYIGYGGDFPASLNEIRRYDIIMFVNIDRVNPHGVSLTDEKMKNIKQFVEEGGTFIMAGGYGSFGGVDLPWIVGYDGTPIEEILPVEITSKGDTFWETFKPRVLMKHFLTDGIFKDHPNMYGLNLVKAKEGSMVLADDGNGNPFLVVWRFGKGRTLAFTSDIGPRWGNDYIHWKHVEEFWHRVVIYGANHKDS